MCTAHLSRRRVTEMDRWELSTCFLFYLTLREEMYVGPTRRDGCVMSKKKNAYLECECVCESVLTGSGCFHLFFFFPGLLWFILQRIFHFIILKSATELS